MAEQLEITYGDKVFKLSAGQKITFKGGKVMQSDIVAKVVSGEEMATVDVTITSSDTSNKDGKIYDYATGEFGDILAYLPVGTTTMTVPIGTKIYISHDGAHTYFNYSSHSGDIEKLYDHRFIINGNGSITGYFTTASSGGSND